MTKKRIEFKSWRSFMTFEQKTVHESRFIHDDETNDFLKAIIDTSDARTHWISKGQILWRAQLGNEKKKNIDKNKLVSEEVLPYTSERMKPLIGEASEGRANPKGIPYLYLSDDKDTALTEVRPWIGSLVSLAEFKLNNKVKLIDCSVEHNKVTRYYLNEPNSLSRAKSIWAHIDKAFSKPIQLNDNTANYVPTQILAELFREEGFDGIIYQSNLGIGKNILLFNIDSADVVSCSLYEAKEINLKFKEISKPPKRSRGEGHVAESV